MRFGMWAGWKAPQLPAHQFDFLLLLDDDPFGEASKHGVAPLDARELVAYLGGLPHLSVEGLMTIGPTRAGSEEARVR